MRLSDKFRRIVDVMPAGSSVAFPVDTLKVWLESEGGGFDPDLTVKEVAQRFSRSEVTIRGWIRDGVLRAYKFRGREYRIPASALEDFQNKESGRNRPASRPELLSVS
jgi:excisionase family DNA binding protein